jgi:hypothetical protein
MFRSGSGTGNVTVRDCMDMVGKLSGVGEVREL